MAHRARIPLAFHGAREAQSASLPDQQTPPQGILRRVRKRLRPYRPASPGRHGDGAQPLEVRIVVQGDEALELLRGEDARSRDPVGDRRPGHAPDLGGDGATVDQRNTPLARDVDQPVGPEVAGEAPAVVDVERQGLKDGRGGLTKQAARSAGSAVAGVHET